MQTPKAAQPSGGISSICSGELSSFFLESGGCSCGNLRGDLESTTFRQQPHRPPAGPQPGEHAKAVPGVKGPSKVSLGALTAGCEPAVRSLLTKLLNLDGPAVIPKPRPRPATFQGWPCFRHRTEAMPGMDEFDRRLPLRVSFQLASALPGVSVIVSGRFMPRYSSGKRRCQYAKYICYMI